MPERRDPPPTDEGWFALHDFRTVDWDAWEDASARERERAIEEGVAHLQDRVSVTDAEEGATAIYSVVGHKADLLLVHLRPSTAHLDAIERSFETTALARVTDQETSYVSVTEASGYSERARSYFEGDLDENSGLANYIRSRLYPTIPDVEHVCFYPMDKRRAPDQNWYGLPFDERAEHMAAHGDIGRDYGGRVTQMITGSIGLDDWEWGVTLWAEDLVDVKELLYEMRFDPSTAEFAEFGQFYVGRRITPTDLPALLAGEVVPAGGDEARSGPASAGRAAGGGGHDPTDHGTAGHAAGAGDGDVPAHPGGQSQSASHSPQGDQSRQAGPADSGHGRADPGGGTAGSPDGAGDSTNGESPAAGGSDHTGPPSGAVGGDGDASPETKDAEEITARLTSLGLHAEAALEPDQFVVVCYSTADAQALADDVADLREQFDHYDTHVKTAVRGHSGRSAVASVWETERAADTAAGFLLELPDVGESVRGPLGGGVAGGGGGSDEAPEDEASDEAPDDEAGDEVVVDDADAPTGAADDTDTDDAGDETPDEVSDSGVAPPTDTGADSSSADTADAGGTAGAGSTTASEIASAAADAEAATDAEVAEAADAVDAGADTAGDPDTAGDADTAVDADTAGDADTATDDEVADAVDAADGDTGTSPDRGSDGTPGAAAATPAGPPVEDQGPDAAATIRSALSDMDVYAGQPHGENVYALVCYSNADADELQAAVEDLSEGFDRYGTHEGTDVYVDLAGETAAIVSLWATKAAADTASEFLVDLPGVVGWADDGDGFGTMGMFYTVKPEHRDDFVETFAKVGDVLADMDGHRDSALLANVENENDMFIASQWDSKEDAMAFFRSEDFRNTVEWGRDVLADRPRHVFLA